VLGINTALHTTAGLAAPVLMGKIVQSAATPDAGYNLGFIIAGVVALAGGLVALLLLRPEADLTRLASAAPLKVAPDAG